MPGKAKLALCKNCKKHARWKWSDGTWGETFLTAGEGALLYLEGVRAGKAPLEEYESALNALENSALPRVIVDVAALKDTLVQAANTILHKDETVGGFPFNTGNRPVS